MTADSIVDCWFLTGPTASGKTSVGIPLAEQLNAEIISLDSMAVYRGMDIGTAKPTESERRRIPHHLIDIVRPNEEFSVAHYLERAERTIVDVRNRGHEVLFVGGTPLYLKVLLRGIFAGPPADWEFREQVQEEVRRVGAAALFERLQQVDPLTASRLHPNDIKRIIRALEVHKLTGRPISHHQLQFDESRPADQCRVFVLQWPRFALHQRIDARVDQFFENGFVDEVRQLRAQYGSLSRTARQAVGYSEVIKYVEGLHDLETTIKLVKTRTHRFAKHQETWFRSLSECRPVPVSVDWQPNLLATDIAAQGKSVD